MSEEDGTYLDEVALVETKRVHLGKYEVEVNLDANGELHISISGHTHQFHLDATDAMFDESGTWVTYLVRESMCPGCLNRRLNL